MFMKILMIAPRLFPYDRPSVGGYYLEHAVALKDAGHEVTVINVDLQNISDVEEGRKKDFIFKKECSKIDGVSVVKFRGILIPKAGYYTWVVIAALLVFQHCVINGRPDVLLAQRALLSGSAARLVKRFMRVQYHVIEHFSGFMTGDLNARDSKRAFNAFKGAKSVAAVSTILAENVKNKFDLKEVSVIPNVVRPSIFSTCGKSDTFRFLTVSNLDKNKRTSDIIKAFALFVKEFPEAELSIVGEGPERDNLVRLCSDLGVEANVEFYGVQTKEGVADIMSLSHCFLLASKVETFGVVVIEALSAGMPVIATRNGGCEDIIREPFLGAIVGVGDVDSLYKNMVEIKDKYGYWGSFKNKRHEWVEENYSPKVFNEKVESWVRLGCNRGEAAKPLVSLSLHDFIRESFEKNILSQNADGSFPSGHNGPYHDIETPVRTTSHWLMVMSYLEKTGYECEKLKSYANLSIDYLLNDDSIRPGGTTFICRESGNKDRCNGLIGQAWVAEALYEAGVSFEREDSINLAKKILRLHPFDSSQGIWYRVEPSIGPIDPDPTFNHQLWFAAISARYGDEESFSNAGVFLDKVLSGVSIYPDGVIFHKSMLGGKSVRPTSNREWAVKGKLAYFRDWLKLYKKSAGYHGFNLYALRMLKEDFPKHPFWKTGKFKKIAGAISNKAFNRNLPVLDYGFRYNPSGIEIAYFLEGEGDIEGAKYWLDQQFLHTYEAGSNNFLTKESPDPVTSSARIYEAVRMREKYFLGGG